MIFSPPSPPASLLPSLLSLPSLPSPPSSYARAGSCFLPRRGGGEEGGREDEEEDEEEEKEEYVLVLTEVPSGLRERGAKVRHSPSLPPSLLPPPQASQAADVVLLPYLPSSPPSIEAALDLYRRCPDRLHRVLVEVRPEGEEGREEGKEEGCQVESIREVLLLEGQGKPPVSWLALHPSLPPSLTAALRQVGKVGKEVVGGGGGKAGGGGRKVGWRKEGRGGGREGGGVLNVGGVEVEVGTLVGMVVVMGLFVFVLRKQQKA